MKRNLTNPLINGEAPLKATQRQFVLIASICLCLLLAETGPLLATEAVPPKILRHFNLELSYVKKAWVARTTIHGLNHKTLCVEFNRPTQVLSTLEGYKTGVKRAANHYVPRDAWKNLAMQSVPQLMDTFWDSNEFKTIDGAMLITGADMDHLALKRASYKGLEVVALVTAGVRGNAMRMGFDTGKHLEPGTINAIILTNRKLSPRAMTRAMISATEAKAAALQDLDVRSSYQPMKHQATGTGTDNLIVVQGEGKPARLCGGHSKLGELIARAMYAGVIDAIARQNELRTGRSVMDRLKERKVSLESAAQKLITARPFFISLLESAMALDDAWRRGLLKKLSAWRELCDGAAKRCQTKPPPKLNASQGPLTMALEVVKSCGGKPASD
jgi:iron complex transport system substrate-binding protein